MNQEKKEKKRDGKDCLLKLYYYRFN